MNYTKVGNITHYFNKIKVAVLQVTDGSLMIGEKIRIGEDCEGVEQTVDSMQVNHQQVNTADSGSEVGLKVSSDVKPGDIVYKITE